MRKTKLDVAFKMEIHEIVLTQTKTNKHANSLTCSKVIVTKPLSFEIIEFKFFPLAVIFLLCYLPVVRH